MDTQLLSDTKETSALALQVGHRRMGSGALDDLWAREGFTGFVREALVK